MTTLEKAYVMISAHFGAPIVFRVKGSRLRPRPFWTVVPVYCPDISWNWSHYEYRLATEAASPEAQAGALPPLPPSEGQDSGEPTEADSVAFARQLSAIKASWVAAERAKYQRKAEKKEEP